MQFGNKLFANLLAISSLSLVGIGTAFAAPPPVIDYVVVSYNPTSGAPDLLGDSR